jgi:hypothetical protein
MLAQATAYADPSFSLAARVIQQEKALAAPALTSDVRYMRMP